jgi:hypothetical protein
MHIYLLEEEKYIMQKYFIFVKMFFHKYVFKY